MSAEPTAHYERWTVAQDKMLLRMFYDDMGIHAIHKQLQRTYAAVHARLHSITQPEELLKGREFEDYVLSLFNLREGDELILQEWQGDILGVGGEPCNPELLYIIPLEEIVSIISGNQSIIDYLYPLSSFNISMFLQQEEKSKEKAYTLDEKRMQSFKNQETSW